MGTVANVLVGVAALSFRYPVGGAWVAVGYTEDGVNMEYSADTVDVNVDEETFPLERVIQKEAVKITCNMAEGSLTNMDKAMAGSVLAASTITIGAGTIKEMSIKLVGTNPAGFARTITVPLATAVGAVGIPYKKAGKQVVPVTFQALYSAAGITVVDATS